MNSEVLAVVTASAPRRWFGIATLAALGGLLLYVALSTSPTMPWRLFLLVVGGVSLWLADATRRATEHSIVLTVDGLRMSTGEEIAPLDQIVSVKRGTFDLKPSNGFSVILKHPRSRRWQPGMWWALGRRVGVGGVTPAHQAKPMAQMLETLLNERD